MKKSHLLGAMCATVYFFALSVSNTALAATITLQPGPSDGKDAQIVNGTYVNQNFGTEIDLISSWAGNLRSIGLIEFDLGSIPSNADITSATLSLYHHRNSNNGARYDVFRVTSMWAEETVTFNTPLTYDSTAVATLTISDPNTAVFRDWDVTSLVSDWFDGIHDNFGMWIEEIPVGGVSSALFLSSDEVSNASNRPILSIEYTVVPVPAALWLFGSGLLGLVSIARRKKAA